MKTSVIWLAIATGGATAVAMAANLGMVGIALSATAVALAALARIERRTDALLARRDQHLAHTAHELRTPLASILTALELVRSGYAGSERERDEFLAEADLAARHLAFLVNDVLDAAAMATGHLQLSLAPHRVRPLLDEAMAMLGLQAERRGVPVQLGEVADDLVVHTDPRRFQQVLFNLVGNAIKFSSPGQPVSIDTAATGTQVRFVVRDRGPGVPAAQRAELFRAFHSAAGQRVEGTGLGLHIARGLCRQLGGSIGYSPGVERGSVFWFELPRLQCTAERTIAPEATVAR
jgi:signal transduction histidine kinase